MFLLIDWRRKNDNNRRSSVCCDVSIIQEGELDSAHSIVLFDWTDTAAITTHCPPLAEIDQPRSDSGGLNRPEDLGRSFKPLKGGCKIVSHVSMNWMTCKELWVIRCKSAVAISYYLDHFQNGGILIISGQIHWKMLTILRSS